MEYWECSWLLLWSSKLDWLTIWSFDFISSELLAWFISLWFFGRISQCSFARFQLIHRSTFRICLGWHDMQAALGSYPLVLDRFGMSRCPSREFSRYCTLFSIRNHTSRSILPLWRWLHWCDSDETLHSNKGRQVGRYFPGTVCSYKHIRSSFFDDFRCCRGS